MNHCFSDKDQVPLSAEEQNRLSLYTDLLAQYNDYQEWKGMDKKARAERRKKQKDLEKAGQLSRQAAIGAKAQELLKKMEAQKNGNQKDGPGKRKLAQSPITGTEYDGLAGNSKAKTLALGLAPITNVFSQSLKAESEHRQKMMAFMTEDAKARRASARRQEKMDTIMCLVQSGVPFAQAKNYVEEQFKENTPKCDP